MATFYSSFFSSGLLAPHAQSQRSQTPRPSTPTTPRAALANLALDDTTPTAPATPGESIADESQVLPSISVVTSDDSRPRLRRRRSSLAGAASPLTTIKTSAPIRQAAASVQRLRARSGSDASILSTASGTSTYGAALDSPPPTAKPTGIIGRLRSGSLGTALRPRRALRRSVPSIPALPPPSAPLPAVPPVPALSTSPTSPFATMAQSPRTPMTPRPPLMRRAQTTHNYDITSSPFTVAGVSPMCLIEDEDAFAAAALRAGVPSKGVENEMQVDYPSPVDNTVFEWGRQPN